MTQTLTPSGGVRRDGPGTVHSLFDQGTPRQVRPGTTCRSTGPGPRSLNGLCRTRKGLPSGVRPTKGATESSRRRLKRRVEKIPQVLYWCWWWWFEKVGTVCQGYNKIFFREGCHTVLVKGITGEAEIEVAIEFRTVRKTVVL